MTLSAGGSVTINGRKVSGPCTIEVRGGALILDGEEPADTKGAPVIVKIQVEGDVSTLHIDTGTIAVAGDVKGSVSTVSGDVTVEGDAGAISTVNGDVKVEGDVSGSVSTVNGDIKHKARKGKTSIDTR
jgi:DUF4097 and DUF4098 domain-containing protein YvlB